MTVKVLTKRFINGKVDYKKFKSMLAMLDIDALNLFEDCNVEWTSKVFDVKKFNKEYAKMCCERTVTC